jgi:hypothetical protein
MEGIVHKSILALVLIPVLILTGCGSGSADTNVPSPTNTLPVISSLTPTSTSEPALVVTVNTVVDLVDGTAVTLDGLIANPGPDGLISLREAVLAADATPGKKMIVFDVSLLGQTIVLEADQQHTEPRLVITGEGITLDGDIDGDGQPDITLDASRMSKGFSSAFLVSSRDITIDHFIFQGFQQYALVIACIDPTCSTKPFQHIRFQNNQIFSDNGGGGIVVSPQNINGPMDDLAFFSDMEISDLEVTGNVIEITNGSNNGIFMQAAGGGLSRNRLTNVVIQGNHIRSPGPTITLIPADANSTFYGFPEPVLFSDDNLVENITINDNILDPQGVGGDGTRPTGIILLAGNSGNSRNIIRGVVISGNEISSNAETGIALTATMLDSYSYLHDPGSNTENALEEILVESNNINAWMNSIYLEAATGQYYTPLGGEPQLPGETGRLTNIRILSNNLLDFKFDGLDLFGGSGASGNRVEDVRIEQNVIRSIDPLKGVALNIYAGGCSSFCTRPSERNEITDLVIQGNFVTCNNFLWLSGGLEQYASDNLVEFYLGENDVTPADSIVSISDSAFREVQGNRAVRLDTAP